MHNQYNWVDIHAHVRFLETLLTDDVVSGLPSEPESNFTISDSVFLTQWYNLGLFSYRLFRDSGDCVRRSGKYIDPRAVSEIFHVLWWEAYMAQSQNPDPKNSGSAAVRFYGKYYPECGTFAVCSKWHQSL